MSMIDFVGGRAGERKVRRRFRCRREYVGVVKMVIFVGGVLFRACIDPLMNMYDVRIGLQEIFFLFYGRI